MFEREFPDGPPAISILLESWQRLEDNFLSYIMFRLFLGAIEFQFVFSCSTVAELNKFSMTLERWLGMPDPET